MQKLEDEKVQALLDEEVARAWASLVAIPAGRLVVWSMLEKCHLFESTFTGNSGSNFMEGERNVGLRLLNEHILPNGIHAFTDILHDADERAQRLRLAVELELRKHEENED